MSRPVGTIAARIWIERELASHSDDCDCNDCVRNDPFCCGVPVDSIDGERLCPQTKGDCDLHLAGDVEASK